MAWWNAKNIERRIPSMLNKKHSSQTKNKISKTQKGKNLDEAHKKKISIALKGRHLSSSTKFKMAYSRINRMVSEKTKQKLSIAHTSKKISEEAKEKMRLAKLKNPTNYWLGKKRIFSEEIKKNMAKSNGMRGKIHSDETKTKLRKYVREKASQWQGGKSFEPYGLAFNKKFKNKIRKRDDFKCVLCDKTEKENKQRLHVHHIDYNKKNNDMSNCISLCSVCHGYTKPDKYRHKYQLILSNIMRLNYG